MLQKEIRVLVERGLHTQGFLRYGNLDPQLVNLYLNKTINDYLDSVLIGLREGNFEDSTVLITDLAKLKGIVTIAKVAPNTFSRGESYIIVANSGDTYRDWIRFSTTVTSKYLVTPTLKKVRITDEEFVEDLLIDTYHETSFDSPVGTIVGNEIRVYKDSEFTLGSGELVYLKEPEKFDVINKADNEYALPHRIISVVIDRTVQAMREDDRIIDKQKQ